MSFWELHVLTALKHPQAGGRQPAEPSWHPSPQPNVPQLPVKRGSTSKLAHTHSTRGASRVCAAQHAKDMNYTAHSWDLDLSNSTCTLLHPGIPRPASLPISFWSQRVPRNVTYPRPSAGQGYKREPGLLQAVRREVGNLICCVCLSKTGWPPLIWDAQVAPG